MEADRAALGEAPLDLEVAVAGILEPSEVALVGLLRLEEVRTRDGEVPARPFEELDQKGIASLRVGCGDDEALRGKGVEKDEAARPQGLVDRLEAGHAEEQGEAPVRALRGDELDETRLQVRGEVAEPPLFRGGEREVAVRRGESRVVPERQCVGERAERQELQAQVDVAIGEVIAGGRMLVLRDSRRAGAVRRRREFGHGALQLENASRKEGFPVLRLDTRAERAHCRGLPDASIPVAAVEEASAPEAETIGLVAQEPIHRREPEVRSGSGAARDRFGAPAERRSACSGPGTAR